jgi:endonuclease G
VGRGMAGVQMKEKDIDRLVKLLVNNALSADPEVGVKGYFLSLVKRATLPLAFKSQRAGWTNDADFNARELVTWALARGINPDNSRYTTLGSILEPELERSGLDTASTIAALMVAYKLIRDPALLDRVAMRYQIPRPAASEQAAEYGPDIDWRGPSDPVELQSWFRPEPDLLDVGFLIRAINKATSVCRVEVQTTGAQGTGFLIDSNLVLTNYHVLGRTDEEVAGNAHHTILQFGVFTSDSGEESKGQQVKLSADKPVVALSSDKAHDFALLQISDKIHDLKDIAPVTITMSHPASHSGLNILQHPKGGAMKLAVSCNGVTGVYEDTGYVQYVSRTSLGSSGSPCFNDDWNVVAIHHAVRSRFAGAIGEGILMSTIYKEIKKYLSTQPV